MNKSGAVINSPTPSTKLSYSIKKIRQPVWPSSKPKRSNEFDSDDESPRDEMPSRIKGLENMMEKLISETITINRIIGELAIKPKSPEEVNENLTAEPQPLSENVVIEKRQVSKKEYAVTSTSVRACFATNRITNVTTNSMDVIRASLGTTGLESILDGHRTEPVVTSSYRDKNSLCRSLKWCRRKINERNHAWWRWQILLRSRSGQTILSNDGNIWWQFILSSEARNKGEKWL